MKIIRATFAGALAVLAGCHHHDTRSANDKVHVKAPFTDVRVGENGGAKVSAPFTKVETTRFKDTSGTFIPPSAPAVRQTSSLD